MIAAIFLMAADAVVAPAAKPMTLQQRYDAAIQSSLANQCATAIPLFEGLESEASFKPGSLARSMLEVQKGRCQIKLGLLDDGEAAIQAGLPGLRKGGEQFQLDVAEAITALGDADMGRWNYAGAKAHYLEARALPNGVSPTLLAVKLAKATAFDGGPEPLEYADEAIRLAMANQSTSDDQLAALHTIHARILLNQGNAKDAYAELKTALKLSGGLGYKVDMADIALRSDLAVAAQLAGDAKAAQEYLAYTGAGRMPKESFGRAAYMKPPVCGTETGLQPQDLAIVDLAIGEDGRVIAASTIYSPGSADVAAAFAKAVSEWVWDPAGLKTIPTFLRSSVHVELRCTQSEGAVPGIMSPVGQRFYEWAGKLLGEPEATASQEASEANETSSEDRIRPLLDDADPLRRAAANGWWASYAVAPAAYRDHLFEKALAAAREARAPQHVINWLRLQQTSLRVKWSGYQGMPATSEKALVALLDDPDFAEDALAADTARIDASTGTYARERARDWQTLLSDVAADDRLPPLHPLRQHANLLLANNAAGQKDFETAQRYFAATGLTEEQCALIGPTPAIRKTGLSANDFPVSALQYGFEGWVNVEYDILGDGKPSDLRTVIAYPPFIFSSAAENGLGDTRFESSYRPGGNNACSANTTGVAFRLPR